jgi:hypothetical protein
VQRFSLPRAFHLRKLRTGVAFQHSSMVFRLHYLIAFRNGAFASLRLRNQLVVALVTIAIMLTVSAASAKQTIPYARPHEQLVKVGAYPTQVVATVRSFKLVKTSSNDDLGNEFSAGTTVCVVKLRIHTTKALTEQGTTINDDESLEVISRAPIDEALVGKTVKAQIEMRGDNARERWLLTEVVSR